LATGGPDGAEAVVRLLLATGDNDVLGAARLRLALSSIQMMRRRLVDALQAAEAVAAAPGLPDELYNAADVDRLLALVDLRDLGGARELAEAILSGGRGHDEHEALAGALTVSGLLAWHDGRLSDALSLLRAATRRADLGRDRPRQLFPALSAAPVLIATGQLTVAEAVVDRARRQVSRLGDRLWAAGPATMVAFLRLAKGRLRGASAAASTGLALSERRGTRLHVPAARSVLTTVSLLRGRLDEAAEHLDGWRQEPPSESVGVSHGARLWAEARLADARGDQPRAAELVGTLCDDPDIHRRLLVDQPGAAAWLVRASLTGGDPGQAAGVVATAAQLASLNAEHAGPAASARHARGLAEADVAALTGAAAAYREPWAKASAFEDAGVVHVATGNRCAGVPLLYEAHAIYYATGADGEAARTMRRIKEAERPPRRVGRHGPRFGWASLTETEDRVARAVAAGRTNAEVAQLLYMSRHTVDAHLRKIFQKLAIRSRVMLARIVVEQGDLPLP
jgi:ATP/maltotriose-dependent transcriptional regulator MalT